MQGNRFLNQFVIDEYSATPKYQQVVNAVLGGIRQQQLAKNSPLPSINEISFQFDISRLTVEKGYNELRKMGVLMSVPGKGYFVADTQIKQDLKIYLLFNKLSSHKKIIYDSFVATLGDKAAIDFYIYNNDYNLFAKLLGQQKGDYTHYVVIPHVRDNEENAVKLIEQLPKEKLVILDKAIKQLTGEYGAVYENFERDIYKALVEALPALSKYDTLKLIFPENSYVPKEVMKGFQSFCQEYAFQHHIVYSLHDENIGEGQVFVNLMEDDLVNLLEKIIALNLKIGEQVGVISYNETPLKKFIMSGLTTISTDFAAMGTAAANLILNNDKRHIENPFYLTLRGSL